MFDWLKGGEQKFIFEQNRKYAESLMSNLLFKDNNGTPYHVYDTPVGWYPVYGEKMTRKEAELKLYPKQWGTEKRKEFLDGLEALGLIKFEEKPVTYDTRTIIFSSQSPCAYQAIAQLECMGYEIKYNVGKDERK